MTTKLIKSICDEIEDLEIENPWMTYLNLIDDQHKKASIRWMFTKPDTRVWFARVLKNMTASELETWALRECFVVKDNL